MNPAYKKINDPLRIGPLTMPQWTLVAFGVLVAVVWMSSLSPFGRTLTIVTAVYGPGLLIGAAIGASVVGLDLWWMARTVVGHQRIDGRLLAGASETAVSGYVVDPDPDERAALADAVEVGDLWAA
jgi:hypothetical protein